METSDWAAHTLGEFISRLSVCTRSFDAVRLGMEYAVEALEAEVGAVVDRGTVLAATGVADDDLDALIAASREHRDVEFAGLGRCQVRASRLDHEGDRLLIVGRLGDDPYTASDVSLLNSMARALGMAMRMLQLVEDEREQRRSQHQLQRAVESSSPEVRLHYQPVVNAHTGRCIAVEALVRWQHPERGEMPPKFFIPASEDTGLILDLGEWVLRAGAAQVRRWQLDYPVARDFTLAVNVSRRQLVDDGFTQTVAAALDASGLAPDRLVLEVVESAVMVDPQVLRSTLQGLRGLGVRIALDDFGTGHSSLSELYALPIDIVKIDKSFVDRIPHDQRGVEVVTAIIELSRILALTTIAEGVETVEQCNTLREMGVNLMQGFHYSPPVDPEKLTGWFRTADPS